MSWDVGLDCYNNGQSAPLSGSLVLRVLRPFIRPVDDTLWELSFPDGGGRNMCPVEGEEESGLCINRPSGADVFDAIYEIMRETHSLFWWEGGLDPVTADPSIAAHLPAGFIEEFGAPALVRSGADIPAEIAKT